MYPVVVTKVVDICLSFSTHGHVTRSDTRSSSYDVFGTMWYFFNFQSCASYPSCYDGLIGYRLLIVLRWSSIMERLKQRAEFSNPLNTRSPPSSHPKSDSSPSSPPSPVVVTPPPPTLRGPHVRWRLVSFVAELVNDVQFSSSVISLLDLASVGIKSPPLTFVCFVVVVIVTITVNSWFVDMSFLCCRSGSFTVLCFTWWNLYALFGWKLLMTYIHQDFIWSAFVRKGSIHSFSVLTVVIAHRAIGLANIFSGDYCSCGAQSR
ncbi:hypothetical protein L195_g013148 [Trifolium pratense]|uniref:Uncharacterized protein n=1 Tax=Trifolium pratense TaxID=57577 RepID=A0A2K3PMC4_TRIPR|nr:hypothetical protein L195_g013148 [Trifolium pratense]